MWFGGRVCRSVTGVQQGDLLGPLLFWLGIDAALRDLQATIRELQNSTHARDTATAKLLHLLMFYLDDGVVIASHSVLQRVLEFFSSEAAKVFGFHLRLDKCSVCWPSAPSQKDRLPYPLTFSRRMVEASRSSRHPSASD